MNSAPELRLYSLQQNPETFPVQNREALWLAHQRRRWMLPDPSRRLAPDRRKWIKPEPAWNPAAFHERKYSADQPRVPAGNPDGGQWTSGGVQLAGDIPTNGLPEIPKERPETPQERNRIARSLKEFRGPLGQLVQHGPWLKEHLAELSSYRDPPRALEDLNEAATVAAPRGYHNHHIVEQGPARDSGLPEELIEGYDNLARVPKLKHEEITGWFSRENPNFGGMSPRDYLRDKSWNERYELGLYAMRAFGVLKP